MSFKEFMTKLGRYRLILDRQSKDPYLERYYLFLKDRKKFPFNVFIHKFLKSDPDDLHDHPWPFMSIILRGGYYEWVPILKDRKKFPFNVFIHKFLKSDPDDLHDHPWPFMSIILRGGYYEWVPIFDESKNIIGEKKLWRKPGFIRFASANDFHRVELKENIKAWTLFLPGPQKKDWGFLKHNSKWNDFHWVHNDVYLKEKSGT